ncbi:MAG: TonB-dependent receptor, partial [Bryobacteraceae bacterium]
MKLKQAVLLCAAVILLVGWSVPASAQVLYGSVLGVVQDASGSVVPNATITLSNDATGQTYENKTDDAGRYTVVNVSPGAYTIKIAANGFRTFARKGLIVSANTLTREEAALEVGSVNEQITVEATATALQTDKADTHTELSSKQVANLPLPGYRNYQSLINLVPGATPAAFQNSVTDTPGRSLSTNVNGTNRNNNMTRIDGASSVNLWLPHHTGYVMPAEMVDTVNVTTSAGDAEQGMAGGAAITLTTKSGTNQFHGSAFEYNDNQHLKARNFFQAPGVDKPVSIYNNYGGTIGGPIIKNKLFFFYSFDGTRQRTGALGRYSVPTADLRAGDFSAYPTVIYDPATGTATGENRTPFAGNQIPANRISPIAQKIQAYYPAANLPGSQNNFFGSQVPLFNRDYNDGKVNWSRNDRHQVFGHYGIMKALSGGQGLFGDGVGPSPGSDPGLGDTRVMNMSIGHNYTFSPTLLLDGVIGYQRMDQTVKSTDYGKDFGTTLGIPGLVGNDPAQAGFPDISINGYDGFGAPGWMPAFRTEETYTMSHNLSWTKGAHAFRFGFDGVNHRMTHYQPELGAGPRGFFNFGGGQTALGPNGSPDQYNGYASFLLGQTDNIQKSLQYILMTPREWQFGWYAQDRWQITPKLTLTMGLRYELYPLMTRATGKGIERLDPATNLVYLGGRGDVPKDVGVSVSHKLFAPKIGLAYRLNDKTVIRTGYGINYDPLPFSRPLRGFYPLTVNFNFQAPNGYTSAGTLATGIPPVVGPDLSTGIVSLPAVADMRSPYAGQIHRGYIQSWTFTIERRLPSDMVATVAYVGTQTVHQLADRDINAGYPGSGIENLPYYASFGRATATNMWDG